MWHVLRSKQGEPYELSPPTRGSFTENSNHIARFECRPAQKPENPHSLTKPYGVRLYSKLLANLFSNDLILRQKAVSALVLLFFQKEEHIVSVVQQDGINDLIKSLQDTDEGVRVQACLALTCIVGHPSGQRAILAQGLIKKLIYPVLHDTPSVCAQGLRLLAAMDAHHDGYACTEVLVQEGCIPIYIQKLKSGPSDEVRAEALKALYNVYDVKEAYIQVLDNDVFEILTSLIDRNTNSSDHSMDKLTPSSLVRSFPVQILQWAAENISKLCFYSAGKRAACDRPETTMCLLSLLDHQDAEVRSSVSGALMGITIQDQGKELCLLHGGCQRFLSRLKLESSHSSLINVIKCICNVSENPRARSIFHDANATQLLKEIDSNNQSLKNAIIHAINTINWNP